MGIEETLEYGAKAAEAFINAADEIKRYERYRDLAVRLYFKVDRDDKREIAPISNFLKISLETLYDIKRENGIKINNAAMCILDGAEIQDEPAHPGNRRNDKGGAKFYLRFEEFMFNFLDRMEEKYLKGNT